MAANRNNKYTKQFGVMKPHPPPDLSKETLIIWEGWSKMGDREVAREAASKGLHTDLAVTFLSQRKNLDVVDTEKWFRNEILSWAIDLLTHKTVFKATHILNNIKLDPIAEITIIFKQNCNKELRNFLGAHLLKVEQLSVDLKQSWQLLESIERHYDILFKLKQETFDVTVEFIHDKPNEWKNQMAAELFFINRDSNLEPLLTPMHVWKTLIRNNNTILINNWINIQFSCDISSILSNVNIEPEFIEIFKRLNIDNNLINQITEENTNVLTKELIYDELSKYGIFNSTEHNDAKKIILRLSNNKNIDRIYEILNSNVSNIDFQNFIQLILNICIENDFYSVLDICTKKYELTPTNPQLKLINEFRKCVNDFSNVNLKEIILNTSQFLNLSENALILIFTTILTKDITLKPILTKYICDNQTNCDVFESFSNLKQIYNKSINNIKFNKVNIYDLINKHMNISTKELFYYRFNNDSTIPQFSNNFSSQSYKKRVNYIFYLKQKRPSKSLRVFKQTDYHDVDRKIFKLAIKNFLNHEFICSCIAFLKMLEKESTFLRIHVHAARIIFKSNTMTETQIIQLFLSADKWDIILKSLETTIFINIDLKTELNSALKQFDFVVNFAVLHNLKLPEFLLIQLAEHNLWLPLLFCMQIYNYPLEQSRFLLQHFNNYQLLDHLNHSMLHDIQYEQRNSIMKERDSRNYFLSKIGVRKNIESNDTMISSISSQSSVGSSASSGGFSDLLDSETLDYKTDLLMTLIKCHNSTDPPKALLQACQYYKYPLFAVLATSYEPDSVVTSWLTWLAVSSDCCEIATNYESIAIIGSSVTEFLQLILKKRYNQTLQQSFEIFLNDNPLKIFMTILNECIKLNFDKNIIETYMISFANSLKFMRSNSIIFEIDHEMIYLNNKIWIENTAIALLISSLEYNFGSKNDKIRFLKLLNELEIQKYFFVTIPNLTNLLKISESLLNSDIDIDFSHCCDKIRFKEELMICIRKLVAEKFFEIALNIAQIAKVVADFILIEKWKSIKNDWHNCDLDFKKYNIRPKNAIHFYVNAAKDLDDPKNKFEVLKLAYNWCLEYDLDKIGVIETQMWISFLKSADCEVHTPNYENNLSYTQMKNKLREIEVNDESNLTVDELKLLDTAMEHFLNNENIYVALRLQTIFGRKHDDLEILKLCLSLAEGLLMPYQLSTEERLLLNRGSNYNSAAKSRRRTFLSTRLTSLSSVSQSPGSIGALAASVSEMDTFVHDTVSLMENLIEKLKFGIDVGQKVMMTYRISVNIEKSYQSIAETADPMFLLKEALNEDCRNKLEVVNDFILVYKWSPYKVADFLCEEMINAIINSTKTNSDVVFLWDINLDTDVHLILQLLPDNCTILGTKLYTYASALHKAQSVSNENPKISEIRHVIELLVRAHDCYTTDCNMEGISVILNKCQTMISLLVTLKSWKLIVRLLTGVGRYTEMNYVFHILRENDQFEYLLRKGKNKSKDNGLKMALLDYLRKYCPENRELYRMVALRFTLFSEVAQLWECESESIIRNLIAISKLEMQNKKNNPDHCMFVDFTNTDGTKICLNKAMVNYNHAAEYHIQGGKLAKAMNAAKQAELIALQMSLLKGLGSTSTATCLLNQNNTQLLNLMSNTLSFPQALILTEAYNYHVDWATILFEQCIVLNNINYLDNYLNCLPLTDTLVHDISRRFLSSNLLNNEDATTNMKEILNKLPSVHTKYRIASELGFNDLVEDLLNGNRLVYLKDTVWKRGYKNL